MTTISSDFKFHSTQNHSNVAEAFGGRKKSMSAIISWVIDFYLSLVNFVNFFGI